MHQSGLGGLGASAIPERPSHGPFRHSHGLVPPSASAEGPARDAGRFRGGLSTPLTLPCANSLTRLNPRVRRPTSRAPTFGESTTCKHRTARLCPDQIGWAPFANQLDGKRHVLKPQQRISGADERVILPVERKNLGEIAGSHFLNPSGIGDQGTAKGDHIILIRPELLDEVPKAFLE